MTALLQPGDPSRIAMLLFPGIPQLDLTGPYEVRAAAARLPR